MFDPPAVRPAPPPKAAPEDFRGRFREILSDPINLLIRRVPDAGTVRDGRVRLHNGNEVSLSGPGSYYGAFSDILVLNRGVHEPLEEYAYQEVIRGLGPAPVMIELGAYWAHYSMWLKRVRPDATVIMVEPEEENLAAGRANFAHNRLAGEFLQDMVAPGRFEVDAFRRERAIGCIDVLHADIQGAELEMLEGCAEALVERAIGHLFISTHSQQLHAGVIRLLASHGYRIDLSSDFDRHTTSYDGLVVAAAPTAENVFADFAPLGREEIAGASPRKLIRSVARRLRARSG